MGQGVCILGGPSVIVNAARVNTKFKALHTRALTDPNQPCKSPALLRPQIITRTPCPFHIRIHAPCCSQIQDVEEDGGPDLERVV
jgi:hypothetical protein